MKVAFTLGAYYRKYCLNYKASFLLGLRILRAGLGLIECRNIATFITLDYKLGGRRIPKYILRALLISSYPTLSTPLFGLWVYVGVNSKSMPSSYTQT